jgi:hypothetical protein
MVNGSNIPNMQKLDPTDLQGLKTLAPVIPIRPDVQLPNSASKPNPGVLEKIGKTIGKVANAAFGVVETVVGIAASPLMMLFPVAVGTVSFLGKGAEKAGNKLKLDRLAKAGAKTQEINKIKEATLEQVAGGNRFSNFVAEVSGKFTKVAGDAVEKFTNVVHLDTVREKRAAKKFGMMNALLKEHEVHHGAMSDELKVTSKKVIESLQNPKDLTPDQLKEMQAEISKGLRKLKKGTDAAKAAKSLEKAVGVARQGVINLEKAAGWKGAGQAVADLPKTIAKSSFATGVVNTAFIAGSGLAMFGAAKGFAENMSSLKEMCSDITGKPVTTLQVLTGDIPKSISGARSQLLKSFFVSGTTATMDLGIAVRSAMNSKMSPLTFFIPMAIGQAAGMMIGESVIPYYSALKQAHASGQKIPAEAYAEFISKAGGGNGAVIKEISQRYAESNIGPSQIIREISDGTLGKRVKSLVAENEAKKTGAATVAASVPAAENAYSHVAALKGAGKPSELPVVGDFAAAEAARRAQRASETMAVAT